MNKQTTLLELLSHVLALTFLKPKTIEKFSGSVSAKEIKKKGINLVLSYLKQNQKTVR